MMHPKTHGSLLVLGIAGLLTVTGQVYASGLQLTEQSVTGLGRAFAGGSLPNDDASSAYYNPADMMLGKGMQVQAGFTFIGITTEADDAGSTTEFPARSTPRPSSQSGIAVLANDQGGEDNLVPNGYYIMDINDRMRFGVSLNAPFAVSTSYGKNWVGRYHAVDSELTTIDINPSLSYRVSDNLSLGFGVSAQYADATLTQALFNPTAGNRFVNDGYAELKGDDWSYGFNLGATYEFDATTRVGLSYRSRIKHTLEGDRTITNYAPIIPGGTSQIGAKVDWTAPDWLALTAYKRLDDKWAIMGGVRWTNWSLFQELRFQYANSTQTVIEEKWDDSWTFNIGVSYDYNPEWTFRAGYQYDQTPVQSAEHRTPRIPDSDRNAFAVGFSYRPTPQLSLDFGYMYLLFKDSSTNNTINLLSTNPGVVTDTLLLDYNSYGNLFALQASYKF